MAMRSPSCFHHPLGASSVRLADRRHARALERPRNISDLFVEDGYVETGSYRINGGAWVGFDALTLPGSGSNGEHPS